MVPCVLFQRGCSSSSSRNDSWVSIKTAGVATWLFGTHTGVPHDLLYPLSCCLVYDSPLPTPPTHPVSLHFRPLFPPSPCCACMYTLTGPCLSSTQPSNAHPVFRHDTRTHTRSSYIVVDGKHTDTHGYGYKHNEETQSSHESLLEVTHRKQRRNNIR
jgi:hypothetical protein